MVTIPVIMEAKWTLVLLLMAAPVACQRTLEHLPTLRYRLDGDATIGLLTNAYDPGKVVCSDSVSFSGLQYVLASLYAVGKINQDQKLLGELKLGLDILEECDSTVAAVAQALSLLSASNIPGLNQLGLQSINHTEAPALIGVVGPPTSSASISVSDLFNIFDIPLISPAATSDSLSNRDNYPNFFRMVPPDSFQTKVMVDLLVTFNWTYVSVVHSENSYGYNGITYLRRYSQQAGVCIANAFPLSDTFGDEEYENTVKRVLKERNAKVVLIVAYSSPTRKLLLAAERLNVRLIWILSEAAYAGTVSGTEHVTHGSFLVDWFIPQDDRYKDFVEGSTLRLLGGNTFFDTTWTRLEPEKCGGLLPSQECLDLQLRDVDGFWFAVSSQLASEAFLVYATALHKYLSENCPESLQQAGLVKDCLKRYKFIESLYNVSIQTNAGPKMFDDEGKMLLDFRIRQVQDEVRQVGVWQRQDSVVNWWVDLTWGTLDIIPDTGFPESVCAKPCGAGEFYIQGELPCCWECSRCRDNEYVTENGTSCEVCDILTWPDNISYTSCLQIPATFLTWSDTYGMGLLFLGALGALVTLAMTVIVIKYKDRRVIKGAMWQMLLVILTGVWLTFIDVALFLAEPTDVICICNRAIYSMSCTLIFGPLLMKTFRVYLVFRASSKLKPVSPLASASSQYVLVLVTTAIQAGLLFAAALFYPITAHLSMPVRTEQYVELSCEQDQIGLLVPLSWNLFLLALCSVIAFLTRKLPDNFNESWYILLSVTMTLFIWIAFLPTYYAAFFASHKAALLALALILNGMVTLVCLFLPKLYALAFVPDAEIKITDFSAASFDTTATSVQPKGEVSKIAD